MKGLSLFSNVGIGEIFLREMGIDIVIANEIKEERGKFYKHIYPNCNLFVGDIKKEYEKIKKEALKEKCEFLLATPPCQGMSIAGKRNYADTRNSLITYVIDMIHDIKPKLVLIENVPKFLKLEIEYKNIKKNIDEIFDEEFSNEYFITKGILDTKDYGIPQTRKRSFILMSLEKKWNFPQKEKIKTVRETIGELPSVEAIVDGEINYFEGNIEKIKICQSVNKWHYPKSHVQRHVEIMKHTPTGKSAFENKVYYPKKKDGTRIKGYNTTYKRMEWDEPAPTITTSNGAISSQCNVHPGRLLPDGTYSDARALTIFEIMLLFTIPKNWNIPKWASDNLIRQVIGEGIPPLLIKKIIKSIMEESE